MSLLLSKANVGGLNLKNRVVMSPMCMYEVKNEDGILTPFHFAHYGMRAISQVGLIITESTAVEPDGRITKNDLGLWNDQQADKLKSLVSSIHYLGSKIGIQLNHAGRKASDANYPVAPSSFEFSSHYRTPNELTISQIKQIVQNFGTAAKRAANAGVDMVEIHGAHGYLLHQFLSAVANKRDDEYGGSLEKRYRIVREVIEAVKANYNGPIWIRLSLSDYDTTGTQNTMSDWQQIGRWLEASGIDLIDASTGGLTDASPDFPVHDGYQTKFATAMKQAVNIPVSTVGLLDNPGLCEYILQNNQADLIMEGRALLRNTNWLSDAAKYLHDKNFKEFNDSYSRGQD
ncbi:NADH:flavin oxidoreductase/NADH oxidase [Apilactobacillus micheneri]|uniref:NADH:flavin oxidoreductase/NADH oxidase n=1 Tax=Apilactobacillus micheneri TaxID=1899430 RepID=A0ABY2YY60_9LACO|nr:NADH:flavin oxidoreductase/NADH oxidase [Apilactobacillus micheneri]TPR26211.1 NADH:flavin oxidoreductase/NADH oxidase [Apilactobacillus micheneri]TPR26965.1 NADH:flavin oxidoreductase/NADH oxidase [Apilactobacillus micheneri]TPR27823.1 NADH:flavin oxidoreductase/NADH oxidase [Apilactobacillus micheneri]TPR31728.1 NADH:flavin oxidoreductase/NADH oxidase [Apilactobacillus micheneri]TPR32132.1 NADH:flavin oxidoreductase/NADH oxidase [Apilactobacillus micheneri]